MSLLWDSPVISICYTWSCAFNNRLTNRHSGIKVVRLANESGAFLCWSVFDLLRCTPALRLGKMGTFDPLSWRFAWESESLLDVSSVMRRNPFQNPHGYSSWRLAKEPTFSDMVPADLHTIMGHSVN